MSPEDWEIVKTAEQACELASKRASLSPGNNWKFINDNNGVKSWMGESGKIFE